VTDLSEQLFMNPDADISCYFQRFRQGLKVHNLRSVFQQLAVREKKEHSAVDKVKAACGEKYDPMLMYDSKRDVANLLHEEAEVRSVREFIRRKQQQQVQQKQNKKKNRDSWER